MQVIPRFPSARCSELLALYLTYVIPFRRVLLLHHPTRSRYLDGLIWADRETGLPWTTERLSKVRNYVNECSILSTQQSTKNNFSNCLKL